MSMENHGRMILTGENSWFAHRSYRQLYQKSSSSKAGYEGNDEFGLRKYVFSYLYRADSFTSTPKEGVLRIFIDLKKISLSAGFEPANVRSNEKLANHYTTDDDCIYVVPVPV
jgi:hypothetical protein